MTIIAKAIHQNTSLRVLNLLGLNLGNTGFRTLFSFPSFHDTGIVVLILFPSTSIIITIIYYYREYFNKYE